MIKKIFFFAFLLFLGFVSASFCFENRNINSVPQSMNNLSQRNGIGNLPLGTLKNLQTGNTKNLPQGILNNLPPGALNNLPPGAIKQLPSVLEQNQSINNGYLNAEEKLGEKYKNSVTGDKNSKSKIINYENKDTVFYKGGIKQVSIIEQQYRNGYSSLLSGRLLQFGYDIFNSASVKASSLAVPDKNYIIGPGDHLLIRVWGTSLDVEYPVIVDREGVISIPKIGPVPVSGLKYGDLESVVKRETEKYVQGINISITLTRLRSLEIYVVGEVRNPGLHMVPAFSTIFDGLMYAGGVKKTGTLRKIKLKRDGREIQCFDLYDLLLHGNRKSDKILHNKDVIFVQGIGKTAAVAGAVNNPAIFEIVGKISLNDLVKMAGGLLPQAFGDRIYLKNYDNNRAFVVQDIDMAKNPDAWNKIKVKNGDLIELDFMGSSLPYVVKITGNVLKPAMFHYYPGMRLSDVLKTPDILMPDTLTKFALLFRYNLKTTRTTPMRFPLADVFSGRYDAPLHAYDNIVILSRSEVGIQRNFTVGGAVWKPGKYKYEPGLRLKDVFALAGGLKFGARTGHVEICRQIIKDNKIIKQAPFVLDASKDADFPIQPYDSILIPLMKNAAIVKTIAITGEVLYPGTYTLRENERISDLIKRAGGFSENAYLYGAKYTSEKAREIQQQSINKMLDKLQINSYQQSSEILQTEDKKLAEATRKSVNDLISKLKSIKAQGRVAIKLSKLKNFKGSRYDFKLHNGDTLYIPSIPSFVSVVGSVYSPGSFLYEPDKKIEFYLDKSGGPSATSDEDHMYLLKANGEIISAKSRQGIFATLYHTEIKPGDTIVVPEDLDRVPYLRRIRDITDIAFKIATTAGVALSL